MLLLSRPKLFLTQPQFEAIESTVIDIGNYIVPKLLTKASVSYKIYFGFDIQRRSK